MAESKEKEATPFSVVTHTYDSKTRKLSNKNPYRLWHIKDRQYFERPVGSGNLFTKDGIACGRITHFKNLTIEADAAHIPWSAPKTDGEMRDLEYNEMKKRKSELEAELSLIKKEQSFKTKDAEPSKK